MAQNQHIILVTIGSFGDVIPFIDLGRALKRRGHEVALITSPYFEAGILEADLEFCPLGTDTEYEEIVAQADLFDSKKGFEIFARKAVVPAIRVVYQMIRERFRSGRTIVASSPSCFGARVAQDAMGVPLASIVLQPCALRSLEAMPLLSDIPAITCRMPKPVKKLAYWFLDRQMDSLLAPELNRFRTELGLPVVRRVLNEWRYSPECVLGLFPDWFAPVQPDWPRQLLLTGFPRITRPAAACPLALEEFLREGTPPVVFSPGSAMRQVRDFFSVSIQACQAAGRRGILLTHFSEGVPSPLPAGMIHVPWVPLADLLPRCAALVHSGGIGTLAEGLAAGVPQLVVPRAYDQPDNAVRIRRLGVGLALRPAAYTPSAAAHALSRLLQENQFLEKARSLAGNMQGVDAISRACERIESLAMGSTSDVRVPSPAEDFSDGA